MSTGNWIYMILILGLVWGGFLYCLFLLMTNRDSEEDAP